MKNDLELEHKRHSLAHLLAAAVLEMWPDTKNTIGPAIDNGFYYDFDFGDKIKVVADQRGLNPSSRAELAPGHGADSRGNGNGITENDLAKIEKKMREIVKKWDTFQEIEVTADEAKKIFAQNPYKLELITDIEKAKEKITLYYSGPKKGFANQESRIKNEDPDSRFPILDSGFLDLCRGGHVENPSKDIIPSSWKLSHLAGAYWRGDEKNKMLTRIYGLAFNSKEELDAYEKQIEEAKKRDHKKLGRELDLFVFSELVGAGLPLWTPKGTLVRNLLDEFVWTLRKDYGYERVEIPHITKKELYEKSGHWEKFKDELFKIKTREGHEFAMKPMNCPHHTQIYNRKQWSYRELPQRYANTTMCYRDEQTGELSGLSRVRSLTQDDAHVFCRMTQVKDEIQNIWTIIANFYGTFGFVLTPRLSLHDPKNMKNYLGDEASWQKSETALREIVKEKNVSAEEKLGEAAFYGPKLDFMAKDSLGREWQVATIQLDMNQPERFDLTCINEKGEKERIVMIHAAIMGSLERFLSVLIEHIAGLFPVWLSPVQVKILPVGEAQTKYAKEVFETLKVANIRAELDDSGETLGKKIRSWKVAKIPYSLVIGDKEISANVVTVESRDRGNLGTESAEAFSKRILEEIKNRK